MICQRSMLVPKSTSRRYIGGAGTSIIQRVTRTPGPYRSVFTSAASTTAALPSVVRCT